MQLLFYQAPLSALLLMFVIPFVEPVSDLTTLISKAPPGLLVSTMIV